VEAGNAAKHCTVIIGHKEIEGIQKTKEIQGSGRTYRDFCGDFSRE
jgi:hypothetical protein